MEELRSKYNGTSDKLQEKNRQYQKLQVHMLLATGMDSHSSVALRACMRCFEEEASPQLRLKATTVLTLVTRYHSDTTTSFPLEQ